jgi:putative ABC transport system permease protein
VAWAEATVRDIRFALRSLRKSPAFSLAAVGTLALGMGANTAIFQLLDAVRLRNLPVPNPQQLARVQIRNGNRGFGITEDFYQLTYPLWQEIRNNQQPFSSVFAWTSDRFRDTFRIGEGAQARSAPGLLVSGEFFSALEVQPTAGRFFSRDDDRPGCAAQAWF